MKNTWKVTGIGTVTAVAYTSTDKSGRDERGFTTLTVVPETIEADVDGVSFGETLACDMDAERLVRKLGRAPAVGDRVEFKGTCTGVRPRGTRLDTIQLHANAETEA